MLPVARRYAQAVYALASAQQSMGDVVAAFAALAKACEQPTVRAALLSPALPRATKEKILLTLGAKMPPLAQRAASVMARGGRAALVALVADVLAQMQASAQHTVHAQVVAARPLSAPDQAALTQALRRATGQEIALSQQVDPELLGGMIVELGSQRLDGSLAGSLQRLASHLAHAEPLSRS